MFIQACQFWEYSTASPRQGSTSLHEICVQSGEICVQSKSRWQLWSRGPLLVCQLQCVLDWEAIQTVTHVLVSSHLDYCKALYMGLSLNTMQNLYHIQNVVVYAVMGMSFYAHVTPLLCELHWLPISFWVQFKEQMITYNALHGIGPGYLKDCLSPNVYVQLMRSSRVGTVSHQLNSVIFYDSEGALPLLWHLPSAMVPHRDLYSSHSNDS